MTQRDCVLGGEVEGREALGTKQERRLPGRGGSLRGARGYGDKDRKDNGQGEGRFKVGSREMVHNDFVLTFESCPFLCRSFCMMF